MAALQETPDHPGTHPRVDDEEVSAADGLALELLVTDREVIEALAAIEDPDEREAFALTALRLGVLALGQARGELDAARMRREGDHLLGEMSHALSKNATRLTAEITGVLKEYLDPSGGKFAQRVERLVAHDGELASVLRGHVAGEDSEVARTLAQLVGRGSPLFKQLDPEHADGLPRRIESLLEQALAGQREKVLEQFSLDRDDSALTRLLKRITDENGQLRKEFTEDFSKMVAQFSLDDEQSALSRLVRQVDVARAGIVEQFSLDDERSALSRLKRELAEGIETLTVQQRRFQQEVMETLSAMAARKQAEDAGTAHGKQFEERVSELVQREAEAIGDVFVACGNTTGAIRNCKVGDQLVELGPESAAPGGRIVFEAKQDKSYDDAKALAELETARKNRDAGIGVFLFSSRIAGTRPPFRRVGEDLLVVWDPEDPRTDVYVKAAFSVARSMVFRRASAAPGHEVDTAAMDQAILEIQRLAEKLDTINRSGETIKSSVGKILDEARKMREGLTKKTEELEAHMESVKLALSGRP